MTSETTDFKELDDWEEWHTSKKSMFSFSFGSFGIELVGNAFAGLYFFFYETELLLPGIFLIIANTVFAIWNAVNDPLMGRLTETPRKFWGRWGKRFPWIAVALIPMYICYFLLFTPPDPYAEPFLLFLWMMVMLCLADTFYSLFFVSWQGMFPEKYRTDKARRKGNTYKLALAITSVIVGTILPPEIYDFNDIPSYSLMAAVIMMMGIVAGVIVIYGAREDPARKAQQVAQGRIEKTPFFSSMKIGLKNRAFLAFIFLYFGNKIWDLFVIGSVPYYGKWILGVTSDELLFIYASFIIGQILSVPLFTWLQKKMGFYKAAVFGGFLEAIMTFPLLFIYEDIIAYIWVFFTGVGNGALWVALSPILSEALDSLAVDTGKRESGTFVGIYVFFGRLAIIFFTFMITLVHIWTGFDPDAPIGSQYQTDMARLGIMIVLVLIPSLGVAIFTYLFSRYYDIKGEKKTWLSEQMKKLDLQK